MPHLVLASQSPRRRELLKLLGHPFECTTSGIEEHAIPGEQPGEHVTRLAEHKSSAAGASLTDAIVIGSDTVVVIDGGILEKPESPEEAVGMLLRLQGRTHTVFTGFALYECGSRRIVSGYETTQVTMREFSRELAERYVETGEPMDKAGAYGIQGYGAVLIERVDGCYFNVMGLPLSRLMTALHDFSGGFFGYFGHSGHSRTQPAGRRQT